MHGMIGEDGEPVERAQVQDQKDSYPKVRDLRVFDIAMFVLGSTSLSVALISLLYLRGLGVIIGFSVAFYIWVIYYWVTRSNKERQVVWQRHRHEYLVAKKNLYRFIAASEGFALEQLTLHGAENQRRYERATSKLLKNALELTRQEPRIESELDAHYPSVAHAFEPYLQEAELIWHQWQHVKMNAAFWSGSSHLDEAISPLAEELKEAQARFSLLQHHIPSQARFFVESRLDELNTAVRTVEQVTDALQRQANQAEQAQLRTAMLEALTHGGEVAEEILGHLSLLKRVYVVPPQKADGTLATLPTKRTRLESTEYVRLRQGLYRTNATFAWMMPHPDYDFTRIDREISPWALRFNRFWGWWQRAREKAVVEQLGVLSAGTVGVFFVVLVLALMDGEANIERFFAVGAGFAMVDAAIFYFMARHFSDRWAESYLQASIFRSTDRALWILHERLSQAMLGLDDARLKSLVRLQDFEAMA